MLTPRLARSLVLGAATLAGTTTLHPAAARADEGPSVQTAAFIRVVAASSRITTRPSDGDVMATVPQGAVLETLTKDHGHYWVLLERDDYGTRRAGFISIRDIEPLSAEESATRRRGTRNEQIVTPAAARTEGGNGGPQILAANTPAAQTPEPTRAPATAAGPKAAPKEMCEVLVHFQTGKSDLLDQARQQIESGLAELNGNLQGITYEIEGHADSVGTEPFNEALGLARAEAVRQYLAEKHSVPLELIKVVSYGETRPMATNATKAGRALNRRVVLKIFG